MMAVRRKKTTLKADIFDQLIADDVKRDVDIISLFNNFGVKLNKKGNSYIGLCPFHDDKNPSLSVDKEKGLFNCFGCGESGDQITVVEKMQNLNYKESCNYLSKWKKGIPATYQSDNDLTLHLDEVENQQDNELTGNQKKTANIIPPINRNSSNPDEQKEMPAPEVTADEKSELTLNDIVEEYHKNLLKNTPAIDYLKSRGIIDHNIITDYMLGFCDGNLTKKLSKNQIEILTKYGLFWENGTECFKNCIIFPIYDEYKKVVGLYGRSIKNSSKVKHLYLKGAHKSVFNRPAVKVYSEQIILTECIIDAVSLIQLDIHNVLACYGTNGFTDQMLDILKSNRVKEIIIAFDNDDAGKNSADKLKEELVNEGFAVKTVFPPLKKDWNEGLNNGITKERIDELINNADVFKKNAENSMNHEIKGSTYYFTKDGMTYKVIGFKGSFTTELKLNFRCYLDNNKNRTVSRVFNIYSEKAVELYARKISEDYAISQEIIKSHFDSIIEIFEDERERLLDEKSSKFDKKVYVLSPSEEKDALDILTGSDVIADHLLPDTEKIGLVGEKMNKIICYHAIISRLWRRPVNICTLSMYGMGKSFLHDTMHRFVPDEDLKDYSRITKNDLYYREEENAFVNKILSIDEVDGIADSLYSIRTLISKGYLSISYPSMDPVTGKMRNEENKVFGRPGVFVTGTNDEKLDEETLSRFAVCTTDASNDQRLRIKMRQFFEMTRRGMTERRMEDEIVKKHKNIMRMIGKIEVVFPDSWIDKLNNVEAGEYSPRNHQSYLSFIASSAIRDQYNRKVHINNDYRGKVRYVEITKEDVRLANSIMLELFGKSTRDLKPPQMHFFKQFQEFSAKAVKGKNLNISDVAFYEKEIREYTGLSYHQVNRYLNDLVKLEYVGVDSRGKFNQKKYKLLALKLDNNKDSYLSGLINPDEL